MNDTFNFTIPKTSHVTEYVTREQHLFGTTEILIIAGIFIFLSYWHVKVTQNKERYEHWINPSGREVNLYKIMRRVFWAYVTIVIIFGLLAILIAQ